ncbi:MAG: thioesterase family protein, partial [Alphaproteobacteria bacterium]
GAGPDYVAAGRSYFTVESHIRHLAEIRAGARLRVRTRILTGAGKKLHLFHAMEMQSADTGNWTQAATGEHMLIHVDLKSRAASSPRSDVETALGRLAVRHARLPRPDGAGRAVGQSSSS